MLWLDIKVLTMVVRAVLRGEGVSAPGRVSATEFLGVAAHLDSVCTGAPDPIRAFADCRETDTAVALVHEPDYFPTMVKLTSTQLQLSGHSHGGQVRLPLLGPVILPRLGRIYHTGLHELNGRFVYTGRGLGMVRLPLRFDCPPELTEITLKTA